MRFLLVSSPHGFTTRDLFCRARAGLAANGAEVVPYDLLPRWRAFEVMMDLCRKEKFELPPGFYANLLAYEPLTGAALFHDVDAVLIVSPQYCPTPIIDVLRKAGKKTIGYFSECPYEDTHVAPIQASHFDYTFVNDRNSVGLFQSFCERVFYQPHCYDPALHYPPENGAERERNVIFVGTGYPSREAFFNQVRWGSVQFDIYGLWWHLRKNARLRRYLRGDVVENDLVAELYRKAGVGLSLHRTQRFVDIGAIIDDGEAYSAGPRTWELAACGTFQVSDRRQEIADVFEDTVPFYKTPAELTAIIRHATDDPVWRDEQAARQRQAAQAYDCKTTFGRLLEAVA